MSTQISNPEVLSIEKNCLGTLDITMKLKGMRKAQDFTVYAVTKESTCLTLQSSTRIAQVTLDGLGAVSKSHASGAFFPHLSMDKLTPFQFAPKDWKQIVEYIGLTEGEGDHTAVKIDNSGAKSIFGLD